jgi:CRISPR-associated protein Cst2
MAYRLPQAERVQRVTSVLKALADMQGGAKQAIHYTDVTPAVVICAVTRGGNHPFNYLFQEQRGVLQFQEDVLMNSLEDAKEQLLSPVYIGWKHGFSPEARQRAMQLKIDAESGLEFATGTPRTVLDNLTEWLRANAAKWDE